MAKPSQEKPKTTSDNGRVDVAALKKKLILTGADIVAIGEDDCPIAAAGDVMAYFARENAGQCGACFRGTPAMSKAITALGLGTIEDAELDKLRDWSVSLRGRGACATLDGAAQLAGTIFREFPEEIGRHREATCPCCRTLLPARGVSRFSVTQQDLGS